MAARRLESLAGVPVLEITAKIETRLRAICGNARWRLPVLCTPEELMGDEEEGVAENA